jgi:REP element-mobilizing transposase RayT
MGRHRNSQKRIYIPGATYFITTVTHGRYPYFEEEVFRELFVDELLFCSELKSFSLYAYAVMPDHAHVLIRPTGGFTYSQIMHFIKRHCARNANFIMGYARPDDDDECAIHPRECAPEGAIRPPEGAIRPLEGAIGQSRLRGDAHLNEFLMKIRNYREKFVARHGDRFPHPPFKWQKSYHDHIIRDMDDLRNHLAYIARQCSHHGCEGSVWVDGMGDES